MSNILDTLGLIDAIEEYIDQRVDGRLEVHAELQQALNKVDDLEDKIRGLEAQLADLDFDLDEAEVARVVADVIRNDVVVSIDTI